MNDKLIESPSFESLSSKVIRGGAWIFGLRSVSRGIGFIRTLILARLLAPEDFGLLGIALLAIAAIENFSQTGFEVALIQKKELSKSYLDTAWTVSAIRGALLSLLLLAGAPWIAGFFNSPKAALIIMILACSTALSGLRNTGIVFFQKELQFKKQCAYEFSITLVDVVITVTLAFMLRNVWALVWGGLAANFTGLFMSYLLHPYRPQLSLHKNDLKELFHFGKWLTGSGILIFLVTQGDDIFVGKALGVAALGLYQMAYLISNLPATEITHMLSRITFPAYSKMKNDMPRLRAAYLDVLKLTFYIVMPLAVGIYILAPDFTRIFLSEKWGPLPDIIQVLVLAGLLRSVSATTGPIFNAVGRPGIDTLWQTVRLIVMAALIYPLTLRWGLFGASVSVLCSIFVFTVGSCLMVIKITQCELKEFSKLILLPCLYSLVMIAVLLFLLDYMQRPGIGGFFLLVGAALASYFFVTVVFEKVSSYGIIRLLKEKSAELL